jgi:DNA-binding CsgD family transcriptional regulator
MLEQVLADGVPAAFAAVDLGALAGDRSGLAGISAEPVHTALLVPMRGIGAQVGVMGLARTPPLPPYGEHDFPFVQDVADRLGLAVSIMHLREELDRRDVEQAATGSADGRLEALTDRERDTFRLIVKGLTSREIAEPLFLSVRTVEWHRARLMAKLGVSMRSELIALGRTLRP